MIVMEEKDRQYVLDRLDRKHIEEVAANVRRKLSLNIPVEACYQPGDGTWYSLVFANLVLVGGAGGGTAGFSPTSYIGTERTFVAYVQSGTTSSFDELEDAEWVASKLTENKASALAIAELIKEIVK